MSAMRRYKEHCQQPSRTPNAERTAVHQHQPRSIMKTQFQPRTLVKQASPWVVPILLLIVWQWASSAGILPSRFLPAPRAVLRSFVELSASGELWSHVRVSALRALSGFVVGGGLGLLLGLLTGSLQWAETLLDTTIQMVRNIPPLALIPLVILWFLHWRPSPVSARPFCVGLRWEWYHLQPHCCRNHPGLFPRPDKSRCPSVPFGSLMVLSWRSATRLAE